MIATKDDIDNEVSRYSKGFSDAVAGPAGEDQTPAEATKLAASSMSADGFVKNSGYFDAPKLEPGKPVASDSSVDDQIRAKKSADRQERKEAIKKEIERLYPDAKARDRRAEERLKQEGL